jgi:hypothetical protein
MAFWSISTFALCYPIRRRVQLIWCEVIPEALQEASHFMSLCRNTRAFQVVLFHIERIGRIGLDELLGLVHLEVLNLHRNYGTR